MACCDDCASKVRSTEFTRTILSELTSPTKSAYHAPVSFGKNILLPYKALLRRTNKHKLVQFKVGVIGSHGRIGQSVQGVGSIVIPGDMSNVRSPVRSRLYEAITPGGGRFPQLHLPNKPNRGYRCPEGFQFGGRFTDNRFSTCGQMLFDIPTLGQTLRNIVARTTGINGPNGNAVTRELGAVGAVDDVIIRRAAQIPRAGAENKAKRAASISSAIDALNSADDKTSLIVRADGYTLLPVVSARVLRTIPDNRNMDNGTYVMNVRNQSSIGGEELGLLSNAGISEIVYGLPNGSSIGIRKKRPLTVGERRKLGRTVNSASSISNESDPSARLRAVVAETGQGMEYFENFKNINSPNDLLDARVNGRKIQIKRWAKEAFAASGRKKITDVVEGQAKPSRVTVEKQTGLNDAVKHLDNNKSPFDIASGIVADALRKSNAYQVTKSGNKTIYRRGDGKTFMETRSSTDYQHLGERVYSDLANAFGIDAPEIGFVGTGNRRSILSESVDTAIDGATVSDSISPEDVNKAAITKIAALDWLLDVRQRDATTISHYKSGNRISAIAGMSNSAALSGLSSADILRRETLKLDKFYDERRLVAFKQYYRNLTDEQRKQMLAAVDELLNRARKFSWENYISRLTIDGELSDSEKRHLTIVKRIYDNRVKLLSDSRQRFIDILGA